jgi:hypothetical protein
VKGPDSTTSVEIVPGQGGGDERRQPAGQGEDGAGHGHRDEQDPVAAPTADPVAVPRKQDRDECVPGENRREDRADGGIGVSAVGERDADEHGAEPVCERPRALRGDDSPRVATHAAPAPTSALHQA